MIAESVSALIVPYSDHEGHGAGRRGPGREGRSSVRRATSPGNSIIIVRLLALQAVLNRGRLPGAVLDARARPRLVRAPARQDVNAARRTPVDGVRARRVLPRAGREPAAPHPVHVVTL